jgi:nucleoside-diphosphate-sugar epimerase
VSWVVLGCGYTGARLAQLLHADGEQVIVTVRDPAAARALGERLEVDARACDVTTAGALDGWVPAGATVVDMIPPTGHSSAVARALLAAGGGRLVYLSTTGVYGPGAGAWVDEDTPVGPTGERGRARLAAEDAYLVEAAASAGRLEVVILRVPAIYGPGRGVHVRLAAGDYRVPGDGQAFGNRIHVDDLARVILAAGRVRPLRRPIYVVGDDLPATQREVADGIAALLGLAPPPSAPLDALSPMARELASGDRRVRNARMKEELGIDLLYPTWREGVRASL